jgi:hypothetical protein
VARSKRNGIGINVEDIGSAKPVVFIHGWPIFQLKTMIAEK